MVMLAARSFRVLLAVALAANCCLPCYTLAYADESTDGGAIYEQLREDQPERAGDGQADQGSDFQGVLRHEAAEEASPCSELPLAVGAGRFRPSAHVLVEASYSLADSLIRLLSARAYADESQEVEDFPEEEQEEIAGDTGGLELSSGVGESDSYAADGESAAEGHDTNDGLSEGTGEDSSGLDGGSDDNGNFFERVLSSLEDITYILGEIADYFRSGSVPGAGDGIVALAGYGGSLTGGFGGAFSGGSGLGKVANTTDLADLISNQWGYNYGKTAVLYKNSPAYWLNWLYQYSWTTHTFPGETSMTTEGSANILWRITKLLYDDSSKTTLTEAVIKSNDLLAKQWGTGYGGTVVTYSNSPASFLKTLAQYSTTFHTFPGESSPTTEGSANILWRITRLLWDDNNKQSVITSLVGSGDVLRTLRDRQVTTHTFPGESSSTTEGSANILWRITRLLWDDDNKQSVITSLIGSGDVLRSARDILDSITVGSEGGRVSLYNIGNSIETIKNEMRDLDNLLEDANTLLRSIDERVIALDALGVRLANISLIADEIRKDVNSSLQWYDILHGDLSILWHGAADLLPGYADWTLWDFLQGIYFDLGNVVDLLKGLQQTLTVWGNRWDSQDLYLMEWAKRWDALDKSPVDLSETNKLLGRLTSDVASIRDKYVLQDALSTILDVLVGDLQTPQTQAALSSIQNVMSTRFPFCIPSLVNVVLFGSILADAAPPVWEFDIAGSPLVVDFSDYGQFAEACRWTVLVLFTASLLLNTRRFIYGMGGGVE